MTKAPTILLALIAATGVHSAIRLAGETSQDRVKLSGRFERSRTGVLVLSASEASVEVLNPESIPPEAYGIPVSAQVERRFEGVEVSSFGLALAEQWERDKASFESSEFESLKQAYDDFGKNAAVWLQSQSEANARRLTEGLDRLKRESASAYVILDEADERRVIMLRQFEILSRTGKAFYLHDDRYPPETYERIYENSRGSVGLFRDGDARPYCSGVLVADDLVLSCLHCLRDTPHNEIKIKFNYEDRLDGSSLTPTAYQVDSVAARGSQVANSSERLDFALLKLKPGAGGESAGKNFPVQCLSLARVHLNEPLYVVGHPAGNKRTVHDNAFVYYPFEASENEYNELRLRLDAEFANSPEKGDRLREFEASYRRKVESGVVSFFNYSQRWRGQPTIGADCDTFHGNSGSPVFNRRTNRVVGLLFDGEQDLDTPYKPGWKSHEAILPITEIVSQLDQGLAGWRARPGVCIN